MANNAVLLATYNGEAYLNEQLDSLFQQTVSDFVIYVHDDGSNDGTLDILKKYQGNNPGRIVLLEGAPLKSAKANFLWMLEQVEADYYLFCDQDDVWFENKIEKELSIIQQISNDVACVFSDMMVVDKDLSKISESFIRYIGRNPYNIAYTQILIDNPAAGCTMCISRGLRDAVIAVDKVDLNNIPMHDAYILEIAALTGEIQVIDEPLVYYRQTGNNTMGAKNESTEEKLQRNATAVSGGGFFAEKKAFVNEARLFAKEMLNVQTISAEKRDILMRFANISSKGKLSRMLFYKKYNFTRAKHNLWMRLWV